MERVRGVKGARGRVLLFLTISHLLNCDLSAYPLSGNLVVLQIAKQDVASFSELDCEVVWAQPGQIEPLYYLTN
jgi:hypothetical protein